MCSLRFLKIGLKQALWLLLIATLPALLVTLFSSSPRVWSREAAGVPEIAWAELQRWTTPALLIDARSEAAFETAHIPGALVLNEPDWESDLPKVVTRWRPGARLVVYCDSAACGGSQAVARRLRRELGVGDIYVLKGGWQSWLGDHTESR